MIDAHIHAFPPELSADPWAWARQHDERHWAETVAPMGRRSLQGWADADDCLRAMDAAGIEKSLLLGWYWQQEATCNWHNSLMEQWHAQHPDRFLWFAAMPMGTNTRTLHRCLKRAKEQGAKGIGELHSGVQGFDYSDESWSCLSEYCQQHKWPVNLHVTDPNGSDYPGRAETPLSAICAMLGREPSLRVILAHLGGGLAFDPSISLPQNCLLDTAAMPWLYPLERLQETLQNGYARQLCFGSDFPLRLYPRSTAEASLVHFAESIRQLLPSDVIAAVSGENILHFLGEK
jgi:predicted TIM-barrel fold metal-dependent hydrolase